MNISPFVKRILKSVKEGKKKYYKVKEVSYKGAEYKCFVIKVDKSAVSDLFFDNMSKNYLMNKNDRPYIFINKTDDAVYINLLKYLNETVRQEIQED